MKTWTKSLLIAICLVILNISYATANQTSPPKPDSTVTENTETGYYRQGKELIIYQQVTTNTKVVHEAEATDSYILLGDTEFWDKNLWRIESMIRQGAHRDTMDYSYDWQSIKLESPWVLVRYGSENSKIVEFSPEKKSFRVKDLRTPAQASLNTGWLLTALCLLGFLVFWLMTKTNKFHLLLYYLLALAFLNFMTTLDANPSLAWSTLIGVIGSLAVARYSTKKLGFEELGFLIFIIHGLIFLVCFLGIREPPLFTETTINYWHFNALLISYIASGKILALVMSMISSWMERREEANRLKRRSEAAEREEAYRLKKLQQED